MYHHLDVQELSDGRVAFKLELEPEHPRQPSLLMRSPGRQREQPFEFLAQADGRDYFKVVLSAPERFEYALRVTTPAQCWWLTPKGEEHDRVPHNWFRWPLSRSPVALEEMAGNELAPAVDSRAQGAFTGWLRDLVKSTIRDSVKRVQAQPARPAVGSLPQARSPLTIDEAASNQVSQAVDAQPQARLAFETPAWVRDAVFYQIFPERFARGKPARDPLGVRPWGSAPTNGNFMGGNLQGIFDRLGYLSDLGVTALYLTPIFHSPSNHKYDTMDYFKVDPHLGDLKLLQRLVKTCHRRGLRVVLDGVFNHCSDQHPFFLDVKRRGTQSPYWSWFHIRNWPFPEDFGSHCEVLCWYDCWWGFHTLPKLNYENPQVQDYFLSVASFWLREADTDGWRLDVPNEVTQSFWPKFRHAVKAAKSDAYIVGEIWDDASPWLQGDQFDAVMNYRFQKALIAYFGEEDMDTCAFAYTLRDLSRAYPEPATAVMLNLLGSHDTVRPMTVARRRDQARALESLKLMVAMQFTCAGAPCIYYGDEIGLEGDKDPDCRRCYPWGWEQRAEERAQRSELLAYYKRLIAVRKANPALRRGALHLLEADPGRELYAFERRAPNNRCIVALNRSDRDQAFPVSPDLPATELLSNHAIRGDRVTVPARQAVIVRLEERRRRIGRPAAPGTFWASAGRASVSQAQRARA